MNDTVGEYTWRPARKEDAPAIYELRIDVDAADDTDTAASLDDVEREFEDAWCNPDTHTLLGFCDDGAVAAQAWIFANPEPMTERRAYLLGEVHPEHRGRGLGEYVLSWLEQRAESILGEQPEELPRLLRTFFAEGLEDRVALFSRHGFEIVRYFYRMRRDLGAPIPAPALPEGVELRLWDMRLSREVLRVFNEAFADHWGFERACEEDWDNLVVGRESFRPELSFLALADGEIVSFCICNVHVEQNEREGVNEGWIGEVGVLRPWRKHGIASSLMCRSMRAFREMGLEFAGLGVDADNPTGALGIYERLGFAPIRRRVAYDKRLD